MFLVLACMCTRVHVDSSGHLVSVCLIPDDGSANIMCVCVCVGGGRGRGRRRDREWEFFGNV